MLNAGDKDNLGIWWCDRHDDVGRGTATWCYTLLERIS